MKKIRLGTACAVVIGIIGALVLTFQNLYPVYTYHRYLERSEEPISAFFFYENYSDAPERGTADAGEFILKRAEADLIKYTSEDYEKMAFYIIQHRRDTAKDTDSEILENLLYTGYVLYKSSSNKVAARVGECALYLSYDLYADPIFNLDDLTDLLSQFQNGVDLLLESEQSF